MLTSGFHIPPSCQEMSSRVEGGSQLCLALSHTEPYSVPYTPSRWSPLQFSQLVLPQFTSRRQERTRRESKSGKLQNSSNNRAPPHTQPKANSQAVSFRVYTSSARSFHISCQGRENGGKGTFYHKSSFPITAPHLLNNTEQLTRFKPRMCCFFFFPLGRC